MAVRRLGFYARCGAQDVGWTEHLFDAWFRVLVLPCGSRTPDAETTVQGLVACYRRTMGEPPSTAPMGRRRRSDPEILKSPAARLYAVYGRAVFTEKNEA